MSELGDAFHKARTKQHKQPKTVTEWKEHLFPSMQAELEEKRELLEQKSSKNRALSTELDRANAQIKKMQKAHENIWDSASGSLTQDKLDSIEHIHKSDFKMLAGES